MRYLNTKLAALIVAAALLPSCIETGPNAVHSTYSNNPPSTGETDKRSPVRVDFDPENQVLPFPNDLLFEAGALTLEELNGTLNVPIADPDSSTARISMALNDLDGFSTTESWRLAFKGALDSNSLQIGSTVRVFEMEEAPATYPDRVRPQTVARELTASDIAIDYLADSFVVKLRPLKPLKNNRTYSIAFTKGIKDNNGRIVDSPITGSVAVGRSAIVDDNGDVNLNICNDPQKVSIALLQCMTYFALEPITNSAKNPGLNLNLDDIIIGWSVTTQSHDRIFNALAEQIKSGAINRPSYDSAIKCGKAICFLDVGSLSGKDPVFTPGGKAMVFPGTIQLPTFTPAPTKATALMNNRNYAFGKETANAPLTISSHWSCASGSCNNDTAKANNELPRVQGWLSHPIVLAVPDSRKSGVPAKPSGGYPLVIFQHAIQQDRSNALAFADALASKGFAVVGIDMPLHGLVIADLKAGDSRAALYAGSLNDQLYNSTLSAARNIIPLKIERTFYLDMDGDAKIDSSGTHFLNPASPLMQRDVLRQAGLDLVTLARYLRNKDFDQCGMDILLKSCNKSKFDIKITDTINFSQLHFIGHSVGNIVAAPFLAFDQDIRTVSMLAPSGSVLRTLEGSQVIGPKLRDGLAVNETYPGTENYYRFFASVQAAIDSIEPLNHAAKIATRNNGEESEPRPIYVAAIAGNEENDGDKVLPLTVAGQPLAGSQALIKALNLTTSDAFYTSNGSHSSLSHTSALQAAMLYKRGEHASFLQVASDIQDHTINGADPHSEMQRQVVEFLSSQGKSVPSINNDWFHNN